MRKSLILALAVATTALLAGASGLAQAPSAGTGKTQEQRVTPSEARYWMGATTGGGLLAMAGMAKGGRPSMADMMRMGTSGPPTEGRGVSS